MRTPDCGVIMFDFEIRQRRKGVCTLVAEPSDSSPYTMEDNSTFCFMRKSFQILSAEAMTSSTTELSPTNAITTTIAPLTTTEATGTTTETLSTTTETLSTTTETLSTTTETLSTTEAPLPVTDSSTTTTTPTTTTPTTTTMTTTSSYAAVVLFYHYFKSLFIHKNLHWAYIAIM